MFKNKLLYHILALLLLIPAAMAGAREETTGPIRIEADRMESSSENQVITFTGHVEAEQGDLFIRADSMTLTYVRTDSVESGQEEQTAPIRATLPGPDQNREVSKLTAEGNVEVQRRDWRAVGDRLDYFSAEQKVVMTGKQARAWQDKNMVIGERIVLFLEEGKSVVERNAEQGERVKAFIYPGEADAEE